MVKATGNAGPCAAEVERLVDDLPGGQVAGVAHPAGRAERARQRATGLAGDAERVAAVAVAHEDGLDRMAVVRAQQRLDGAVPGDQLTLERQRRERDLLLEGAAQFRAADPSSAQRRPRPARPTSRSASRDTPARRARRTRRSPTRCSRRLWWQARASCQVPSDERRRVAARGRADHPRRTGDASAARRSPIPRFGVGEDDLIAVDGRPCRRSLRTRRLRGQQAGRASSRPRATRTVARRSSRSFPHRCACIRSAGSTSTRPGLILLTNDGELAHRLTHPSFEVMRTYRAVVENPPVREEALRRAAPRRRARRRPDRAGARDAARARHDRADDPRGPQAAGQTDV